jgi:hypothetical protein
MCENIVLTEEQDRCKWLLKKGQFSVKSVYLALKTHQVVVPYKGIWNIKISLRIKVFLWIVFKKSVLTKDNLVRRGWSGDETCRFCSNKETMDHIFLVVQWLGFFWAW